MDHFFINRPLPHGLEGLRELALDLRLTWNHSNDRLWRFLDAEAWERTHNPHVVLLNVSQSRLEELAVNSDFTYEIKMLCEKQNQYEGPP